MSSTTACKQQACRAAGASVQTCSSLSWNLCLPARLPLHCSATTLGAVQPPSDGAVTSTVLPPTLLRSYKETETTRLQKIAQLPNKGGEKIG